MLCMSRITEIALGNMCKCRVIHISPDRYDLQELRRTDRMNRGIEILKSRLGLSHVYNPSKVKHLPGGGVVLELVPSKRSLARKNAYTNIFEERANQRPPPHPPPVGEKHGTFLLLRVYNITYNVRAIESQRLHHCASRVLYI